MCIFLSVRHCIEATWLNDRDQFLYPNDTWEGDLEFQSDCLAYTLFHGQNNISSKEGTNHWIPFTEEEVGAREKFESHFMSEYIQGKRRPSRITDEPNLFSAPQTDEPAATDHANNETTENGIATNATATNNVSENGAGNDKPKALVFSPEAQAVMDAGRELWRYYHSQPKANPNVSFYDIRLHFQGTNDKGKMNPDSADPEYTRLIKELRARLRTLAAKLEPKVYSHRFLLS